MGSDASAGLVWKRLVSTSDTEVEGITRLGRTQAKNSRGPVFKTPSHGVM